MFVKICGITNESDALLAVAVGCDAVGFVFATSSRNVSPLKARDIARRLPPEVLTVGVFKDELKDKVVKTIHNAGLNAAQLHGNESPEDAIWVSERVPVMIKAFTPGHSGMANLADYKASIVLVDGFEPGSGKIFDWASLEGMPLSGQRIMLAGGLNSENVADAIRRVKPFGVDVSTGVEASPGRKDPTKLRAFVAAAKAAGSELGDAKNTLGDDNPLPLGASSRPHPYEAELG